MTIESYREKIRREILRYKLVNREINYKVLVTSGEVRDYFREHIEDYRVPAKVRVNRISFPIPPAASEQQLSSLNEQVQAVRDQLQAGADFEQILAAQNSASGGDMGEMVEADMAEPLQEAIKGLEQGEVSEALQLNDQLHLLQVSLRTAGDPDLFDRVKGDIEKKLRDEKTDVRFKEWQQEIRANAFIDKRL
jgi:peptidyl-prolyl cis-trans isomerase SurA